MVCFSVCLIVSGVPVSAANDEYTSGFVSWSNNAALLFSGTEVINVLNGYFPASFSLENASAINSSTRMYGLIGSKLPRTTSSVSLYSDVNFYVDVLYSVPLSLTATVVPTYNYSPLEPSVRARLGLTTSTNPGGGWNGTQYYSSNIALNVDGTITALSVLSENTSEFEIPAQSFEVEKYWGYRFSFPAFSLNTTVNSDVFVKLFWEENRLGYEFSDPNYQEGIYNEIIVNTGILQEINGNIEDIKISTTQMSKDISAIKDTVTDTSEQLQNPSSNIWQAAGSTISGAIESLFVPSEQDIAAVKDGFDQLAQDKLGGAYTAMETVDSTLEQVNDKLNNPSAAEGVEFPGISVPLGGEIGTVTLLEAQMVTMPVHLTTVLHPIAGTIVSIVCGLGTFNVLKDMVECFLSGFSYSEFLHRNKGGSDE